MQLPRNNCHIRANVFVLIAASGRAMLEPRCDVPIPDRDDPLFAPSFWQGTAAGELRVQQCPKCKAAYWPRPFHYRFGRRVCRARAETRAGRRNYLNCGF